MRSLIVGSLMCISVMSVAGLTYGLGLSSKEVINYSYNLNSGERQEKYLANQVNEFINNGKIDEARLLIEYLEHNFYTTPNEDFRTTMLIEKKANNNEASAQ